MKKQFPKLLLILALCLILLAGLVVSVQAQAVPPTPTVSPAPGAVAPTPTVQQSANPNEVSLAQLRQSEIQLNGPYDAYSFSFALPADWKLTDGAGIDIALGASFNLPVVQSQSNTTVFAGGGTVTVLLNNAILAVVPINSVGEIQAHFAIPLSAFITTRTDGRMLLSFVLNSGYSCLVNGEHMIVFIHPTSTLTLPHDSVAPSTSLLNFPRPIFQNSFVPDSALVVVPDQPSAAELQAALTVAAGLGNLTQNNLILTTTTMSNFKAEAAATNHLILVGKAGSLPMFQQLNLATPIVSNQFQVPGAGSDDGLVEMIDSPWSSAHVILIVSGNTDQGIIKAAQAVSTGVLRPNKSDNFAVIQQVNSVPLSSPQPVDQTLADLGFQGTLFQNRGVNSDEYTFNIPAGMDLTSDAYFGMVFGHSALIDYNRSQIVVLLNSVPIASVRMSDATASVPTNEVKIQLPPSAAVPGINRLDVNVNIVPLDDCTPPGVQGLWIKIWPQSALHLPLATGSISGVAPLDLASYPAPFVYNPVLGDTAFVLAHNDPGSWQSAMQIAAFLGSQAGGRLTELSAFYGDAVPDPDRAKDNLFVIGRPSQLPIVGELNKDLPAPFAGGGDVATESNLQVKYLIPSDSPMGYLETMVSPWSPSQIVFAVLGNTTQGVSWAATALIDPTLRSHVGGNFAVINDRQIITTSVGIAAASTPGSSVVAPAPNAGAAQQSANASPVASRPGWILPALAVSVILIALILAVVIAGGSSSRRGMHGHTDEPKTPLERLRDWLLTLFGKGPNRPGGR